MEFRSLKNIESSFRQIRLFGIIFLCLCTAIVGYTLWSSYRFAERQREKIYVLDGGKSLMLALSQDLSQNRPAEAREHVRRFHELFFTLSPDKSAIEHNVRRALLLADKSAYDCYADFAEKGYYNRIIAGGINQTLRVDSVVCSFDAYPYRAVTYATQLIIRQSNVTRRVRQVVSALGQPMTDEAFIAAHSQARNYGFQTAVGVQAAAEKNTIAATVYGNQTVSDGQAVRLRLSEPMAAGERILPKNALITGAAKIQGERLTIVIETLEYGGTLIPTALSVYDTDGQEGIFIPNSMERSAAKEIAANMGTAAGSSMNISTDAGAQLAADLGKGLLQGTSQYFAKKVRAIKVHLKAGYRVLLFQKKD